MSAEERDRTTPCGLLAVGCDCPLCTLARTRRAEERKAEDDAFFASYVEAVEAANRRAGRPF